MATYELAENRLLTCPYDETHRVKQSRYQIHVSKCEEAHKNSNKETCPFNAQHRCEHGEIPYHLMNCPDRAVLDKKLVADADNNTFKGHTGVPCYDPQPLKAGESWEAVSAAEGISSHPVPGYQPSVEPPHGGIRLNFSNMQPAERRKYYESLHHRDNTDEIREPLERHQDSLPELRKPTTVSRAQLLDQQKPVNELQNIGLGRGQPLGSASSRIAANIFGDQAKQIRQPRSAPNIPGLKISNLGMGRGGNLINTAKQVGSAAAVGEMDANRVGLGRGAKI